MNLALGNIGFAEFAAAASSEPDQVLRPSDRQNGPLPADLLTAEQAGVIPDRIFGVPTDP
ncbi:hypothetical protein [Streptomyces sp. NPDC002122]|uniref:hypothetical protein n=1 Tax=Streptomyces sp. NPDC002122 TaxID=3154407 RepID=UPI00331D3566